MVNGTSFGAGGPGSVVSFNQTPLTILSWVPTGIKVQIPMALAPAVGASTAGTVTVTTPTGTSNAVNFTITRFDCSLNGLK